MHVFAWSRLPSHRSKSVIVPPVIRLHTIKLKKTEEETITRKVTYTQREREKKKLPENFSFVSMKICVLFGMRAKKEEKKNFGKTCVRVNYCIFFYPFVLDSGFGIDFLTREVEDGKFSCLNLDLDATR